jgi:hypothetical protein
MYSNIDKLCKEQTPAITSNRHFLPHDSLVYSVQEVVSNDRTNFLPNFWGPHAWTFLETVARGYNTNPSYEERLKMRRFLDSLTHCLPCKKCRNNYCTEVETITDEVLSCPKNVLTWLQNLRQKISTKKQQEKHQKNCKSCH